MTAILTCSLDELPDDGCKGIGDVVLVRRDGQLYVYRNHCPHLGLPLEWMPDQFLDREGHYLQCATHGALFRIDNGLCVSGPCLGDALEALPYRVEGKSLIIGTDTPPTP